VRADYGLGRRPAPDARDEAFPMSAVLPKKSLRTSRYWNDQGFWGDQGPNPFCVGFAWAHWIEDGPITHPGPAPIRDPVDIYEAAQRVDEWDGEDYDGTSVRAGAKVLQSLGAITEYRWAATLDDIVLALLEEAPVVMGTSWYEQMFNPENGQLKIEGAWAGGHAYILNGINVSKARVRMKNSWSRSWGSNGRAWIDFGTLERLLADEGEACIALEVKS
jgi:hypothetical protein